MAKAYLSIWAVRGLANSYFYLAFFKDFPSLIEIMCIEVYLFSLLHPHSLF